MSRRDPIVSHVSDVLGTLRFVRGLSLVLLCAWHLCTKVYELAFHMFQLERDIERERTAVPGTAVAV